MNEGFLEHLDFESTEEQVVWGDLVGKALHQVGVHGKDQEMLLDLDSEGNLALVSLSHNRNQHLRVFVLTQEYLKTPLS